MDRVSSDRAIAVLARYGGLGFACLLLSFLPVGPEYQLLLEKVTLPGALMFLWIAAGLGIYGVARYPSRSVLIATAITLSGAAFIAYRFWQFANAT